MSAAAELYQAGKLREALETATADVKKKPTDLACRYMLAQLLCFSGDLERADTHLDAVTAQEPERVVVVAMYRQLIRGELWRRQVFEQRRVPELLADPTPAIKAHLQALVALNEGNISAAVESIREAEEARPSVSGMCNATPFEGLRDLDDRTASFMEVISSNGKYFWIPTEQIESMEFHAPETLFDLVWRRVHMVVRNGPDGEVFIPTLYPGTYKEEAEDLRLGRATDWRGEEDNLLHGVGQRIWLFGEDDKPVMELQEIEFTAPA